MPSLFQTAAVRAQATSPELAGARINASSNDGAGDAGLACRFGGDGDRGGGEGGLEQPACLRAEHHIEFLAVLGGHPALAAL